jgi:F-type H+-transporting ATPase subunit b
VLLASADFGTSFILELVALVFIAAFIVRKVLPPLRRAMDGKLESIRAQLSAGDAAKAAAAALVSQRREALATGRTEAESLVEQARRSAEQITEDGRHKAEAEYARLVGHVEIEIALEQAKLRDEVLGRIGELVGETVQRVVAAELNENSHHRLIDEAIAAVETEAAV